MNGKTKHPSAENSELLDEALEQVTGGCPPPSAPAYVGPDIGGVRPSDSDSAPAPTIPGADAPTSYSF
ncbi:MAG: hypothetical protein HY791_38860 [Deltaproteobacteria bacterium]|nr:hypothetical protein [Deltaproteobacteria bacterium]